MSAPAGTSGARHDMVRSMPLPSRGERRLAPLRAVDRWATRPALRGGSVGRYMTREGFNAIQTEIANLWHVERPEIVDQVFEL